MKHASAAEAKVAKATERQPPPVLRQRTSELEAELLRRKQAKKAAASEDAASLSSLPDAEHDAAQPMADAEGARAGRGQKRAAEASGAVQAPLQDSNTWAPTHRARLTRIHPCQEAPRPCGNRVPRKRKARRQRRPSRGSGRGEGARDRAAARGRAARRHRRCRCAPRPSPWRRRARSSSRAGGWPRWRDSPLQTLFTVNSLLLVEQKRVSCVLCC